MGNKVGEESISPILLRGFKGFSNNTRPNGSLLDTVNRYTNNNNNALCMDTAEVCSYEGFQRSLLMSAKAASGVSSGFRETSFVQFPVGGESKVNSLHRREAGEEIGERNIGRMTKDFLGLEASASASVSSSGNGSYQLENEFYPYQQMAHGPTPFEKHMWQ